MTVPVQTAPPVTVQAGPTQADAQLMLQLAQLGSTPSIERGQALLWQHRERGGLSFAEFEQRHPVGTDEHAAVMAVMKWHETVGTLVKQGLLHRGLVYDWLWVRGSWDLCRQIALGQREQTGTAALWENFEALAAGQPG